MQKRSRFFQRANARLPLSAGALNVLAFSLAATMAHAQTVNNDLSSTSLQSGSSSTTGTDARSANSSPVVITAPASNLLSQPNTSSPNRETLAIDPELRRQNLRTGSIDDLRAARPDDAVPPLKIGTFNFRPSLEQDVGAEKTVSGGGSSSRTYSQTTLGGEITSDWARHELRLSGSGTWQKNIAGTGETEPTAALDAKLRLDVSRDTTVNLNASYNFARESSTDPNSIVGASVQSGVHTFAASAEAVHEFGRMRGTIGTDFTRTVYGPATLNNGSSLSLSDRNQTTGQLRLRAGYELSPAITPFVEISGGRSVYDLRTDTSGYQRDNHFYAGKAGVEFDFGNKLRGELGLGYKRVTYADARLAPIGALTIDGNTTWSPMRGTDVTLGVSTSIAPSTTAGVSGSKDYSFNAALSQQVIDNLVARLSGSATVLRYDGGGIIPNQTEWIVDAGLTWSLNRYVDLTGDLGWDYTDVASGTNTTIWKAIAGIKLKH